MSPDPQEVPQRSPRGIEFAKQIPMNAEDIRVAAVDIPRLIEEPLRPAVKVLYDRNVRTFMSSANHDNNSDGKAHISIYLNSLSPRNREVLQRMTEESHAYIYSPTAILGKKSEFGQLVLSVDATDPDWIDKIVSLSLEQAQRFEEQPFLWCRRYTESELQEYAEVDPAEVKEGGKNESKNGRIFYDPETGLYFESLEHIQKFHGSMAKFGHDKDGKMLPEKF